MTTDELGTKPLRHAESVYQALLQALHHGAAAIRMRARRPLLLDVARNLLLHQRQRVIGREFVDELHCGHTLPKVKSRRRKCSA